MTYAIQLENVTKIFKRQTGEEVGLKHISFSIEKGEVIGLLGTNGAGKSTLFNCLSGQTPIDSGEILIQGKSLQKMKSREKALKIGRVFQDPRLGTAPRMTVFENLVLAKKRGQQRGLHISLNEATYREMVDLLTPFKLDLENRLDIPIENLSGGQRQAISLIMATLQKPELLLLDEHTAALDPRTANQVMTMTNKMIQDHQLTTIMITHHLQDALTYCDKVFIMHRGHIAISLEKESLTQLSTGDLYEMMEQLVYQT